MRRLLHGIGEILAHREAEATKGTSFTPPQHLFYPLRFEWRTDGLYVCNSQDWVPEERDWMKFAAHDALRITVEENGVKLWVSLEPPKWYRA